MRAIWGARLGSSRPELSGRGLGQQEPPSRPAYQAEQGQLAAIEIGRIFVSHDATRTRCWRDTFSMLPNDPVERPIAAARSQSCCRRFARWYCNT